jgi:FOG: WD40 repeat
VLWVALAATLSSAQVTKQVSELKLNETLERELTGQEPHEYQVTLKANEFVQVRVEQKGIDVDLKLYAEGGTWLLAQMDSPNGMEGYETLSWIAREAGTYHFRVSRLEEEGNSESGRYSIQLTARNPATEANHQRLKGEKMFLQVVKSRLAGKHGLPVLITQYETLLAFWRELKDEQMLRLIESLLAPLKEAQSQAEAEAKAEAKAVNKAKLVVQTNHAFLIQSVAFSLDGKFLATGDGGGAINIWDIETGRQLRTIKGHVGTNIRIQEKYSLSSKSKDWLVKFYEEVRDVEETVHSLAFSPDGKTLVSGSSDRTIRFWDIATGRPEKVFVQLSRVWLIAFSHDGSKLLSITEDGSYKYWDITSEKEINDNPPPLSSFRLPWQSPHGRLTASYSEEEKTIKIIDTVTKRQKLLKGHDAGVRRAVFSPDGKTLASCGWDRTVRLWDTAGRNPPKVLTGHTSFVSSVSFSPNGKLVASVGGDLTVKLWEVETGKELKTLRGYGDFVEPFAFGKDNKILLTGSDNIMHAWDLENGRKLGGAPIHRGYISLVVFNPDKSIFATSDESRFSIAEMSRMARVLLLPKEKDDVGPAEKGLPADKVIRLWDVRSGKRFQTLQGHTGEINALAFSPDGKTLASGSDDNTFKLWNVESGKEIATIKAHESGVTSVAFSPDGTKLASSDNDTIKIWNIAEKKEFRVLTLTDEKGSDLHWLGFSADGKTVIALNENDVFSLWNIESGQLENKFSNRDNAKRKSVLQLVPNLNQQLYPNFTSDLKFAVIGDSGGKISLYDVESNKLLAWLIALDREDWAVVTPDGLFDASPEARKLMHYVIELEPITLEQMKDLYYVPDLLSIIFKGAPLPKVELFSKADLFPLVEYQPPQPNQKSFTVKLINRGGGIGQVQAFLNGKECRSDARPPNFDPNQPTATLNIDFSPCDWWLPGEQNKIEIVTRNAAGSLNSRGSSRGAEFYGLIEGAANTEPPHLYAIIGGVSNYTGDNLDLNYAAKDAEDFAKALEIGATKLFGSDKVHIRLLTSNGDKTNVRFNVTDAKTSPATKSHFNHAFEEFKNATPNDVFIVYLAGHGVSLNLNQNTAQASGNTYLYLTQEATTTDVSVLSVENSRKAMAISSDELAELMKQNRALKQVLILDTCAAGAAAIILSVSRYPPADQVKAIDRLQNRIGFFVLMGASADKVSYEATQYRQGLLTYSLLKGMKGASLLDDEYADVITLFTYAQNSVPDLAKNIGGIQRPLIISPPPSKVFDKNGSFPIGIFTVAEQAQIPLNSQRPFILRPTLVNLVENYDNLNLTPMLRRALREANNVLATGQSGTALAFVDADEMVDAIKPSGLYRVEGDKVFITMKLIRNGIPLAITLNINGKLNDKEQIIKQIVTAIEGSDISK